MTQRLEGEPEALQPLNDSQKRLQDVLTELKQDKNENDLIIRVPQEGNIKVWLENWATIVLDSMMSRLEGRINAGLLKDKKKMFDEFSRQAILNIHCLVLRLNAHGKHANEIIKDLSFINKRSEKVLGYLKAKYPEKEIESTQVDQIDKKYNVEDNICKEPKNNTMKQAVQESQQLRDKLCQYPDQRVIQQLHDRENKFDYTQCKHEELIKEILEHHLKNAFNAKADFTSYLKEVANEVRITADPLVGLKLKDYQKYFSNRKNLDFQNAEMLRIIIKLIENYEDYIDSLAGVKPQKKKYDFPTLDFSKTVNLVKEEEKTLRMIALDEKKKMKEALEVDRIPQALLAISGTVERFQKSNSELPFADSIVGLTTALMSDITYKTAINYLEMLIHCLLRIQWQFNSKSKQANRRINLINFRVFDLVRGMMIGELNQLLAVCDKFRREGLTVRFKNRLQTNNKDLFLNVRVKRSNGQYYSIIGELQLKLLEAGSGHSDDIWHDFTHFIYELERNRLGMITEIFINSNTYNYSMIKYFRDKIKAHSSSPADKLTISIDEQAKSITVKGKSDSYSIVEGKIFPLSRTNKDSLEVLPQLPRVSAISSKQNDRFRGFTCFNCWRYCQVINRFFLRTQKTPLTYLCELCVYKNFSNDKDRKAELFGVFEPYFELIDKKSHDRKEESIGGSTPEDQEAERKTMKESLIEYIKVRDQKQEQAFVCTVDHRLQCNMIRLALDSEEGFKAFDTLEPGEQVSLYGINDEIYPLYVYKLVADGAKIRTIEAKSYTPGDKKTTIFKVRKPQPEVLQKLGLLLALQECGYTLIIDQKEVDTTKMLCKLQILKCLKLKHTDDKKLTEQMKLLNDSQNLGPDQDYSKCQLADCRFLKYIGQPTHLNLSFNELTNIDEVLRESDMPLKESSLQQTNLVKLNISNNYLTSFNEASLKLGHLTKLKVFNLSWNHLESVKLPCDMALQELYLHENRLTSIEFWCNGMKQTKFFRNLEHLSLSENRIKGELNLSTLGFCENLKRLYLTNNFITKIELGKGLNNMQEFGLAGNLIGQIDLSKMILGKECTIDLCRNPLKSTSAVVNPAYKVVYGEYVLKATKDKKPKFQLSFKPMDREDPSKAEENYRKRLDGVVNWSINSTITQGVKRYDEAKTLAERLQSDFSFDKNLHEGEYIRLVQSKSDLISYSKHDLEEYCKGVLECLPKPASGGFEYEIV